MTTTADLDGPLRSRRFAFVGDGAAMEPTSPAPIDIRSLHGGARELVIPTLKEGFEGIYRWHAKRTLRTVGTVRAAMVGGQVAGVAMLERLVPEVAYVYYLAVGAAYRRRGIGRALLDDALGHFRSDGSEVVFAAIEEDNLPSQQLFRSRGFRVVARDEANWRDGGLGAQGLRTRMWIVHGELLFGLRLAPAKSRAPP